MIFLSLFILYGILVHYNEKGNSKDLASALCSAISNVLGTSPLGVNSNSNLIEMNSTSMPAVLMEPIFISNQSDCDKYKKYTGKALGVVLAQTVTKFI